MTPSDQIPPEARRRRLDDLFADEPFLSPTMKARRLHEKMVDHAPMQVTSPAGKIGSHPEARMSALLPQSVEEDRASLKALRDEVPGVMGRAAMRREADSSVTELPVALSLSRECDNNELAAQFPASPRPRGSQKTETTVNTSLTSAAAYLRQAAQRRAPESEQDRLLRFRRDVLIQWLKDVPKREINRAGEER